MYVMLSVLWSGAVVCCTSQGPTGPNQLLQAQVYLQGLHLTNFYKLNSKPQGPCSTKVNKLNPPSSTLPNLNLNVEFESKLKIKQKANFNSNSTQTSIQYQVRTKLWKQSWLNFKMKSQPPKQGPCY